MKRALFIDIDGVINTNHLRATKECLFHHCFTFGLDLTLERLNLDPVLVTRLLGAVADHDVDIVISSMWRFAAKPEWFSIMFALYGVHIDPSRIKFIRTDALEEEVGDRQQFITEFLALNPYDKYAAVDDTIEHFKTCCDFVVLTDADIGITEDDVATLCDLLDIPKP